MSELKIFEQLVLYEHLTDKQIAEARQEAIKHIKAIRNAKIILSMTQAFGEDIVHLDFVDGTDKKVIREEALILGNKNVRK